MSTDRLVFTHESNLQNLADVIREKTHSQATMKVSQMSQKVKTLTESFRINASISHTQSVPSPWVRPSGFPNLDSVTIDYANDEEAVYLTYDNTRRTVAQPNAWAGFAFVFTVAGASVADAFRECHKMKTLSFGSLDFSKVSNVNFFMSGMEKLEDADALTNLNVNISFASNFCLTRQSMLNIMRSLKEQDTANAKTIIWSIPCYNQLSAEDRAVGTSKNWNVAQSS